MGALRSSIDESLEKQLTKVIVIRCALLSYGIQEIDC